MKSEVNKEYTTSLDTKEEVSVPALYQVLVHNDDFTPMEFVVAAIEKHFYHSRRKAAEITMEAHVNGTAVCGTFSRDYAESKVAQVLEYAQSHEHPLVCSMERL